LQVSWRIVNDSYRTDVCLMFAPSLIALACLQMGATYCKKEIAKNWFAELNVDMEKVFYSRLVLI
jgi:cyclin C